MKFAKQLIWLAMSYGGLVQAQEHVHGVGSVFVIQEANNWQVQYSLSASDTLGFEHDPENQQQLNKLIKLSHTLNNVENIMRFNGQCTQVGYSHNLNEFEFEKAHEHRSEHDHEVELGNHDEHEEDYATHHQNIELSYIVECSSKVSLLSFLIFDKMPSLQKLEVEWSIDQGQGAVMLTNGKTQLEFK